MSGRRSAPSLPNHGRRSAPSLPDHGRRGTPSLPNHGRRSAPSLPVKMAVAKIDEWPVFRPFDQFLTDRILQNVISLLAPALIMPQPMFKKIALPADAQCFGRPFFPFAHDRLQRLPRWWKRQQGVQMIRHEQEQMRPP